MRTAPANMKISLSQKAFEKLNESANAAAVMTFLMHASRFITDDTNVSGTKNANEIITTYVFDNVPYLTDKPCGKLEQYYSGVFQHDELKRVVADLAVILENEDGFEYGITILNKSCVEEVFHSGDIHHKMTLTFA